MGREKDGQEGSSAARPISVTFVVSMLRGVARVDFMPSAVCGLFLVAALFAGPFCLVAGATALTPALAAVSAPFGGHAFAWPFVVATLPFLAAVPAIPRLRRA